jgi:uncharacterized membrane protein
MQIALLVHIVGGSLGLVAGAVALFAMKGARLHRKSGMVFVYAMLTLSLTGVGIAASRRGGGWEASVIGGLLTAYLVITALTTVRSPFTGSRWVDRGATLLALAVGLTSVAVAVDMLAGGETQRGGIPVPMFLIHGSVALLGSAGDLRVMRAGGIQGARRLARHLWRMCFALWIASGSFFLGQADELPASLRIPALLGILAFLPFVAMLYWLWRVRIRKSYRGIPEVNRVTIPEVP